MPGSGHSTTKKAKIAAVQPDTAELWADKSCLCRNSGSDSTAESHGFI